MKSMKSLWWQLGVVLAMLGIAGCGDNLFTGVGTGGGGDVRTGVITGRVSAAGQGVGGVRVILVNVDSTTTDSQGDFRFALLPAATYSATIRVPLRYDLAAGTEAIQTVTVAAGGTARVNWLLREDTNVEGSIRMGGG